MDIETAVLYVDFRQRPFLNAKKKQNIYEWLSNMKAFKKNRVYNSIPGSLSHVKQTTTK